MVMKLKSYQKTNRMRWYKNKYDFQHGPFGEERLINKLDRRDEISGVCDQSDMQNNYDEIMEIY